MLLLEDPPVLGVPPSLGRRVRVAAPAALQPCSTCLQAADEEAPADAVHDQMYSTSSLATVLLG